MFLQILFLVWSEKQGSELSKFLLRVKTTKREWWLLEFALKHSRSKAIFGLHQHLLYLKFPSWCPTCSIKSVLSQKTMKQTNKQTNKQNVCNH